MLNARHPRIMLDVAGVGDVEKLVAIRADEVPYVTFDVFRPDFLGPYPRWRVVGRILLIERLSMNTVWKTFEYQRPILKVRYEIRRNSVVIVDEIALRIPVFRPENFVEIGELNLIRTRAHVGDYI